MTERFTLISELGRGGMGVVWKARDEETGQIVALKLLREAYAEDPEYLARFERELELAKRIDSVHVVKVLGFGVRDKVPYLALEYVDGPSLHDALRAHGPYSWPETRALLIQLAQGLADANAAGVMHRDVKPSNVLIGPDGVAKLTDFGIARGLDTTRMTATSTMLGTPAYLAPEGPKDARSDLYSLGIIGYQLLTGSVPFKGTSHQEVIFEHVRTPPDLTKLPLDARPIIGWLLAKDPSVRPQRASALLPILWGAAAPPGTDIATRPATPAPVLPVAYPITPAPVARPVAAWPGTAPFPVPRAQPLPPASRAAGPRLAPSIALFGTVALVLCLIAAALLVEAVQPSPATPGPRTSSSSMATGQPAGVSGTFSSAGSVGHRFESMATRLRDGRVLIAGGETSDSAELYDPASGAFTATGSMSTDRELATATLLADGRVLVAGGQSNGSMLRSAELYDPATGSFSLTGSMATARSDATATLLANGRVLIAGGVTPTIDSGASAELYDPATGKFTPTGSMAGAREDGCATLLADGRVLVVGGDNAPYRGVAEIYDPSAGTFSKTGSPMVIRSRATATLLADGRVLLAGGYAEIGGGGLVSAELYDPKTGSFHSTGSMTSPRSMAAAVLLNDGHVLIAGGEGLSSAELYDPATGSFSSTGSMSVARRGHTATLLVGGSVLIAGGDAGADGTAELYTP